MKAVVVRAPEELCIEERPDPSICNPDDVLIGVRAVGICGSDSHILHGKNPFASYPRVMGHEFVGEVEEVGSGVEDVKPGDHVVVEPITYSDKGYAIRRGMPQVSPTMKVNGVHVDGGMQERIVVRDRQVHKLDPSLPWTTAVLLEPYTIAGNSTSRGEVGPGDTLLIHGAGPIGITVLRVAVARGANVMVSDVVDEKLAFAMENGAQAVVNPSKENLQEAVAAWTDGEMANKIIDAACLPQTFAASFDLASVAGTIVVLGMGTEPVPIAQKPFMQKQLTVVGSRLQAYQFDPMIRLMQAGTIGDDGLVTHTFPLENAPEAFDLIRDHPDRVRKVVLTNY